MLKKVAVILVHVLWACGIHGAAIVGGVMGPIWLSLMDQNRVAFQSGHTLPNTVTQQFFDLWIYMGGSGATLALVVAMLLFARSQQLKSLGRLSIAPGIFNINEMVTFGMPIVLNPLLLIPFILVPVVLTIVTYFAMEWGLAARPSGAAVPWTTPIIFSGYLATGGEKVELSLLFVHAQDHLMNAITIKELASEFVDLYRKMLDGKKTLHVQGLFYAWKTAS